MTTIIRKIFATCIVAVVFFTSCAKSHTCTCKDANGTVMSTDKYAGSNASSFKTNCLNKKTQTTVNGTVTATTPCEYQ